MATHPQLRRIWAAARELSLDETGLRDLVEQLSGQRSISKLPPAQVRELIDLLVQAGARPPANTPRKPSGRRKAPGEIQLITGEQRDYILDLRRQLGTDWERDRYFEGACQRLLKRPRPRTAGEGARVIEMLLRRLEHNRTRQSNG